MAPLLEEVGRQIIETLNKQDAVLKEHTDRLKKIETDVRALKLLANTIIERQAEQAASIDKQFTKYAALLDALYADIQNIQRRIG